MFNFLQNPSFPKFLSLNSILEKHFSYSYIYYFFFPETDSDLDIYISKNNIIFDTILEHIFDINYLKISDEGDGYFDYRVEDIPNDSISFSFQRNLFIPWQFFLFNMCDNPENFLFKSNYFFSFFFSRAFQQSNCFFDLEDADDFHFGIWLYNFLEDRHLLSENIYESFENQDVDEFFVDKVNLKNIWLLECFFSQQFFLFFDPLDRVFLFDALQKHQKFLCFFFDTVFSSELSNDFFKNLRLDVYESSSPFWSDLDYNLESFTGDKWLYFSMIDLEKYNEFTFMFDDLFFLEIDRIYFDFILHFWFFNKKPKTTENFFFNFLQHTLFIKKLKKKKLRI